MTFILEVDAPLSADKQAMLVRLAAMPDGDINCSDIAPSSPDAKWTRPGTPHAAIELRCKPRK